MSRWEDSWKKANTRQINLRLNRHQDADAIAFLDASGSPCQVIRRLIREEIARTGWVNPANIPRPASLSLDGGRSFITPEELSANAYRICGHWDAIVDAMAPEYYDAVDSAHSPCPYPEFLVHYLALSGEDLIVEV